MTNAPLFSIIVPIYNVESYLKECLDSILAQTYKNFELILIDDGSTDESASIAKSYAEQDSRCIFLQQENNGSASVARNAGLDIAKGDYIVFLDSDDTLEKGALAYYAKIFMAQDIDIIYTEFNLTSNDGKFLKREKFWFDMQTLAGQTKSGDELLSILYKQNAVLFTYCWQGTIKREIIEQHKIRFCKGTYFEDVLFGLEIFSYARSVFISPEVFVNYRQSTESVIRSKNEKDTKKMLKNLQANVVVAQEIPSLASRMESIVSPQTHNFYFRCLATILKRTIRILNALPIKDSQDTDKNTLYKEQSRLATIKTLYPYMFFKTRVLWHFVRLKLALTRPKD